MARAITFFPKAVYIGAGGVNLVNISEIFEITTEGRIDLELRAYGIQGGVSITGSLETTSDPTFVDVAWKQVTSFVRSATGTTVVTGLSGLGRFLRGKVEVPGTGVVCVSMNAVARELP
jgi:hypothetical protein